MKRFLLVMLLLVSIVLGSVACTSPVQTGTETPEVKIPEAQKLVWGVIAEWNGVDNKTTEPFTINEEPWAVSWRFIPDPPPAYAAGMYGNYFGVEVVRASDGCPIALPANMANVDGNREGSSYVYERGTFYLDITCLEGSWAALVMAYE